MSTPRMPMANAGALLRSVENALREILDRSDFGDPGSFAEQVLQDAMDNVTLVRQAAEEAGLIPNPRRLRTGDQFRVGIAGYTALSDETKGGNVIVRGHVTNEVKTVSIDHESRRHLSV